MNGRAILAFLALAGGLVAASPSSAATAPLQMRAASWTLACAPDALTARPVCELATTAQAAGGQVGVGFRILRVDGLDQPAAYVAPQGQGHVAALMASKGPLVMATRLDHGRLWVEGRDSQAGFMLFAQNDAVQVRVQGDAGTAAGSVATDGFGPLYEAALDWLNDAR